VCVRPKREGERIGEKREGARSEKHKRRNQKR
jgi:hypothetical protein